MSRMRLVMVPHSGWLSAGSAGSFVHSRPTSSHLLSKTFLNCVRACRSHVGFARADTKRVDN
eukprot:3545853-Heterocapsa_arctica.AAC.1